MAYDAEIDYGTILHQQNSHAALAPNMMPQQGQSATLYQEFLLTALSRLEELLDTETSDLKQNKLDDIKFFSQRKSRALLELSQALRHLSSQNFDETLKNKVVSLRLKLIENQAVLKIYLDAMRNVSELVLASIFDYESDGTYPFANKRQGQTTTARSAWL